MYFFAFLLGVSLGVGALYQRGSGRESSKFAIFLINIFFVVIYSSYYNISEWSEFVFSMSATFLSYLFVVKIFGKRYS